MPLFISNFLVIGVSYYQGTLVARGSSRYEEIVMSHYQHRVLGFLSHRTQAEKLFSQFVAQGIAYKAIHIFDKYSVLPLALGKVDGLVNAGDAILKNIFAGSVANSLAGTGLSSLLGVQLIASEVTLIVEEPLVAQLVASGWGVSLGVIDTNFYTREDIKMLADLVHDAVLSRQIVISVETTSHNEALLVSELIQATIGDLSDVI